MAHKDEHRDVYIAAIIGGIVLILILLWLYASPTPAQQAAADDATAPAGSAVPPPDLGGYTSYNIPPFNAGPTNIGGNTNVTGLPNSGGCCDQCGPLGGNYLSANDFLAAVG